MKHSQPDRNQDETLRRSTRFNEARDAEHDDAEHDDAERDAEMQAARKAEVEAEHALRAANRVRRRRRNRARATGIVKALLVSIVSLGLWVAISIGLSDFRWAQNELGGKRVQLAALQVQLKAGQQRLNALQVDKGRAQSLVEHGYVRPGDRILLFPPASSTRDTPPILNSQASDGSKESGAAPTSGPVSDGAQSLHPDAASQPQQAPQQAPQQGNAHQQNAGDRATNDKQPAEQVEQAAPNEATPDEATPGSAPPEQAAGKTQSMWRRAGRTLNDWWRAARGR